MSWRKSLRWQIIGGIMIVFLVVQGIFGVVTYQNLKFKFEEEIRDNTETLLEFLNQNLDNFIDTPVALLSKMRDMLPQNTLPVNIEFIKTYIASIETVYPIIDHIKMIDKEGDLFVQSTDLVEFTTYNFKNESFFINKPVGNEIIWSNIYMSTLTNKPTITMSENVGDLLLVADINLDALGTIIHRERFKVVKSISILDKYGNYLYDDNSLKVEQRQKHTQFEKIKEISRNKTRYVTSTDSGQSLIVAEKYGFEDDGYLVLELDYDLLNAPIIAFERNSAISVIGLFLMSFVALSFLMKHILKDFNHLSEQTKAISNGNYNYKIEPCRFLETQGISNDFLLMREILENRELRILEINGGLEDINAQLEEEIHEHTNTLIMLREKDADLESALNVAREANMAKSQFLANMSHEIRTPMNGILGMINIMIMTPLSEEQSNYLQTIQSSTNTLMSILNDILDYSKIEAGKVILINEGFSLKRTLSDLNNLFKSSAVHKKIKLNFILDNDLPDFICGDEIRLRQILSNLISNAIKFTDFGGVELHCNKLVTNGNKINLTFKVKDTGIGISAEEIDTIFDRFIQGSNSGEAKTKGTGLGLAISRVLAELMGGKLYLESQVDIGSTFIVEVPFEICNDEIQGTYQDKKRKKFSMSYLKGLEILVAEDDLTSAFIMQMMLSKAGASVDVAENGNLAVEKSDKKVYDIILMDVNMPVLDGLNATKAIRSNNNLNNQGTLVPIIAITAYASEGEKEKCLNFGVNDYVTKPVDFEILFDKIIRLCIEEVQMVKNSGVEKIEEIIETLCQASGFDEETAYLVLETYLQQTKGILERLKNLSDTESASSSLLETGQLLHKLKGSSGNVRANEIMALAIEAEALCNETNIQAMQEKVAMITALFETYEVAFRIIRDTQT